MTVYGNLIEELCSGTGLTITLAGATTSSGLSLPFSSNYADGDDAPYMLEASDGTTAVRGIGTYNLSANTITRKDTWNVVSGVTDKNPSTNITLPAGAHVIRNAITESKVNERLSVKDFGAIGDSVVDDSVAVQAAIDSALANDFELWWGGVNALTTVSITDLHNVRNTGNGTIIRGSDTFHIEPDKTETNTLYVATTGDDTNDGLSSSEPLLRPQEAAGIVRVYSITSKWKIILAAGTYTIGANFTSSTFTYSTIEIEGPDVSGHPNVPTAIIDMVGDPSGKGFSCAINTNIKITCRDQSF